ncbi:MAG: RNA 2',3'-cyclic phosphodiesterase [Candidatus Nanoarchaeia archaeon]|nr:RNA 2',3'-cyclic phosphodiesterase [Candidatus Nanoarchaeia archaeon]MDD5741132.1 RNA 2',3'-cyclic phosphodiesterase [Candidatus Nanoarchaeia archaeon]
MEEKMGARCFIAIDLSREAINSIKEIQKLLKKQSLFNGKFTEPENLHLTLKFLGEISDDKIKEVKKKLQEVSFEEFEAGLGEVGVFSKKFIKIIWIKLKGNGIFELQKQIDEKLMDLFPVEDRFMSHITISRVKTVGDKKALLDYVSKVKTENIKLKVDKFFLKKSELKPEGPVYEDLGAYLIKRKYS